MKKYIISRCFLAFISFFLLSFILFCIIKFLPQDYLDLMVPDSIKPNQLSIIQDILIQQNGLDRAFFLQYIRWILAFLQGDLGYSLLFKKEIVAVISSPFLHTVSMNLIAFFIAISISFPCSLVIAKNKGKYHSIMQVLSIVTYAVPTFFLAFFFIYIGSFKLQLFPCSGMPFVQANLQEWLYYSVLPILTLCVPITFYLYRVFYPWFERGFSATYCKAYLCYGYPTSQIYIAIIKANVLPLITVCLQQFSMVFFGSLIVEYIFAYDGIGRILQEALLKRDVMLTLSLNMIYITIYLFFNLIIDILYFWQKNRVNTHDIT